MLASARIISGLFVVTFGFAWTVGQAGLETTNHNLCDLVTAISPWPISNCSFANWIVWLWGLGALFALIFLIADTIRWWRSKKTSDYKSVFEAALLQNPERIKSSPLYLKLKYSFEPKTGYKSPIAQVNDGKVEFQKLYDRARKKDLESYLVAQHMAEWLRENARFCYASSEAFFDVLNFIEVRMDNLHAVFRNERPVDDRDLPLGPSSVISFMAALKLARSELQDTAEPKPIFSRDIRELLGVLIEARDLCDNSITPVIHAIYMASTNWKTYIYNAKTNAEAVSIFSTLIERLQKDVWGKIDDLVENNKRYESEMQTAFGLDHAAAKNELSRALQTASEALKKNLPPNRPPVMNDLVVPQFNDLVAPQFKELINQSMIALQWSGDARERIRTMIENINNKGMVSHEKVL